MLVDTPIWSIAYRRKKRSPRERRVFAELRDLVRLQQADMIGPVRQEVLCGFSSSKRFEQLRTTLRAFDDLPIEIADYELAANFYND